MPQKIVVDPSEVEKVTVDPSEVEPVNKYGHAASMRGVSPKEHYTRMAGEVLPLVGGIVGGFAGTAAGPLGSVGGAGLGGAAGEAAKQLLYRVSDIPAPSTSTEAAKRVFSEGGDQAVLEATGQVGGRAAKLAVPTLQRGAVKSMTRALNPSGQTATEAAEKAVPELLQKRAIRPTQALTRDQLGRTIESGIQQAGKGVEAEVAKIPAGTTTDTNAMIQALEKYKQSFMVPQQVGHTGIAGGFQLGPATERAKIADKVVTSVQDNLRSLGPHPSFESVLKIKRQMDDFLGASGHLLTEDAVRKDIDNEAVNAIRHELYKPYPDLQRANAEFSMWKNAKRAFKSKPEEMSPYEKFRAIRYGLEIGGGAAARGSQGAEIGATAVALEALLHSTAFKVASANTKDALAKAIWNEDVPDILRISTRIMQGGYREAQVPPIAQVPSMPQPEEPK